MYIKIQEEIKIDTIDHLTLLLCLQQKRNFTHQT